MTRNSHIGDCPRRGLTVLELLVVIGVLGLLSSLLLPAVQQARETARRTQCLNNLKQIALASQNFESLRGFLPGESDAPFTDLLPHLDLNPANLESQLRSKPTTRILLPAVLCPASDVLPQELVPIHYAQNHGSDVERENGFRYRGPDNPLRSRDVTDGLSMTAIFSENPQAIWYNDNPQAFEAACRADPMRCIWHLRGSYSRNEPEVFAGACRDVGQRTGVLPPAPVPQHELLIIMPQATYGHYIPPNIPGCFFEDPTYPIAHVLTAWSRHPGGVNVAFCDGSARFVADSIAVFTWQALGSRNGGEHVGEF
jgi:prepilin-type processing-associated H-X9-DG protein